MTPSWVRGRVSQKIVLEKKVPLEAPLRDGSEKLGHYNDLSVVTSHQLVSARPELISDAGGQKTVKSQVIEQKPLN